MLAKIGIIISHFCNIEFIPRVEDFIALALSPLSLMSERGDRFCLKIGEIILVQGNQLLG